MAKQGWLTIRKVPEVNTGETGAHFKVLQRFFKEHKTCPACGGQGYKIRAPGNQIETTTIKYMGISELEKIHARGLPITDVIREILERQLWKRRRCKICKGSRFMKRDEHGSGKETKQGTHSKGKKKASA